MIWERTIDQGCSFSMDLKADDELKDKGPMQLKEKQICIDRVQQLPVLL